MFVLFSIGSPTLLRFTHLPNLFFGCRYDYLHDHNVHQIAVPENNEQSRETFCEQLKTAFAGSLIFNFKIL